MSISDKIIKEIDMLSEQEHQKVLEKIKEQLWLRTLFYWGKPILGGIMKRIIYTMSRVKFGWQMFYLKERGNLSSALLLLLYMN